MENNNEILTSHDPYMKYHIKQKIDSLDILNNEIQDILIENPPNTFPQVVYDTNQLLNQKYKILKNLIEPIQQTFARFKELKTREGLLNRQILLKKAAIEEIFTSSTNEVSQRYIRSPASGGSKKKINMKKEQKKPSKKKTTIKKTSLKMKSSQLKTTKKK